MKHIKNGLKVLFDYGISLLVFGIFIFVFLSLAKDNMNKLLPFYSLLFFLMAFSIIYTDMKKLAETEKKPQYNLNPYPVKGLIYGLIGFSPIVILEIVSVFIVFSDQLAERFKHLTINTLMGPLYFIIRGAGEQPIGYILASLTVPFIALLGYLAGYYGFNITKYFKKEEQSKTTQKAFKKSPWNPTNKATSTPVKKKKKSNAAKKADGS
ncbi:MAG: hypothetical protein FIA99_00665 [Ruminiclostridium sp.]|nr:hypothetical protein [Ruminiclostridium sp.]